MGTDVKRLVLIIFGTLVLGGGAFGLLMETAALVPVITAVLVLAGVAVLWMLFKNQSNLSSNGDDDTAAGRVTRELKWMVEEAEDELLKTKVKEILNAEEE